MTLLDAWPHAGAAPLHATARDPQYPTDGGQVRVVAQALGTPLMPWQQYVADVAGERKPDGSLRYPIVVVTVPRQSGKTTVMRAVGVARGLRRPRHDCFYTAQTGKDARERWRDLVAQIKTSALAPRCEVRQAAGNERLILPNGSSFRCFSPVATSLHGYTPPLVMLDEAFAHDGVTGEDLMAAIIPAQSTLADKQLWIVSTAGTALSVFLRQWVDAGRADAPGVAIFEWAAADGMAPYDPATWWASHPALGFTIGQDAILAAAQSLSRAEFERAYLNRWTMTVSHVIPRDQWDPLGEGQQPPTPDQPLVLTYDVAHDRQSAAVIANWHDPQGRHQARIVKAAPGYRWLMTEVPDLADAMGALGIGADDGGAAREVTDALVRAGRQVDVVGARDYATACSSLLGKIAHALFGHDGSEPFSEAAQGAALRPMGDGVAFSRRHSSGDISPIVGAAIGGWLLDRVKPPEGPPLIYVGKDA